MKNDCKICGKDRVANGGNYVIRGGVKICGSCQRSAVDPKRAKRSTIQLREDLLATKRDQQVELREKIKQAKDEYSAAIKQLEQTARLSLADRFKFLFDPFGFINRKR